MHLNEEVVGGLREAGYSLSILTNKLLKENSEKVKRMGAVIPRMVGLTKETLLGKNSILTGLFYVSLLCNRRLKVFVL